MCINFEYLMNLNFSVKNHKKPILNGKFLYGTFKAESQNFLDPVLAKPKS